MLRDESSGSDEIRGRSGACAIRRTHRRLVGLGVVAALGLAFMAPSAHSEVTRRSGPDFEVVVETVVAVGAEQAFDGWTGDLLSWWDHTFSEAPEALILEAEPGGRFYEVLPDEAGGVLHATVIYAERGKLLRLDGPLGFSGHAVHMVHSIAFEAVEGGTRITITVDGHGRTEENWVDAIDAVWTHFLLDRFKPYIESGGDG